MISQVLKRNIEDVIFDFLKSEKFVIDKQSLSSKIIEMVNNGLLTSEDLEMNMTETQFIFCYVKNISQKNLIENNIKTYVERISTDDEKNNISYFIIILTDSYQVKCECEDYFSKEYFYTLFNKKIYKKNMSIVIEFIPNVEKGVFKVGIESRIKSIGNRLENKLEGIVVTANLIDIVKIYNNLGDHLFNQNVRYGIEDKMNLQREIEATLTKDPDNFWFLNNGISILIDDLDFVLDKNNTITFNYSKEKILSVINGAQTISIAAKKYYSVPSEIKIEMEKAKVLLRIIKLECKNEEKKKIGNDISIGLNRQKPITSNDIYYTFSFVNVVNEIFIENKDEEFTFEIIKRGSKFFGERYFEIQEFSQIVMAYGAQKPCSARNSLIIKLEETQDGEVQFKEKAVFHIEIEYSTDKLNDFKKYYLPVNFANRISIVYKNYVNSYKNDYTGNKLAIIKYGRWLFTANVVWMINEKSNDDFSNFNANVSSAVSIIEECVTNFVEEYATSCSTLGLTVDSNTFKTDDNYFKIRNILDSKDNEFYKSISKLKK